MLHKGQFSTFDVPGGEGETFPQGINLEGDIAGYYSPPSGGYQFGFLLKGGVFTIIDVPATLGYNPYLSGINTQDDIVGIKPRKDSARYVTPG